jgi:two-component sensor histidine kinase
MKSHDLVNQLCRTHTNLSEEDIQILIKRASMLEEISKREQVDVFIDCPCVDASEAIVVGQALKEDSLYELSTLGYIIREEDEPAVFRSFRLGMETEGVKAITCASTMGNLVVQNVTPIKNGERTIGVVIYEKDYEKDENEFKYKSNGPIAQQQTKTEVPYLKNIDWLSGYIQDAVIIIDKHGRVCFRNAAAQKLYENYGYVHDIQNTEYRKVSLHGDLKVSLPDSLDCNEQELFLRGRYYRFKQFCMHTNDIFYVVIVEDITLARQHERVIQEKAAAIREMHHRIKNSLSIVLSLLDLQKRRLASEDSASVFQDAINRITSISATYEMIQESGQDFVSLLHMIGIIAQNFMNLVDIEDKLWIEVRVAGEDTMVNTDISTSIALIINELMQNCYKHAFKEKARGNIWIHMKQNPIYTTIEVTDDGIGFSQDGSKHKEKNQLGLQIIEMVVKDKLKGRLDISSNREGTKVTFDFKNYKQN